ncbi:MAG: nucleotidyltransferase domain-containing protein [Anaeromicrobium sp.]|uniref:type VII toxin-antitoxin system MntA family adenylyltransferase antitoxin n=1 Tax=Anaeromicrobium sp. TaxID=1929132 RepID=UPI0025EE7428|nr:nucleotidyltransferase domain-containing protein [Anaeromicrobium sp.]MCT4594629.1 nucleotidyltransferase domain-containing protein [Anaeromicrobium sp.]
MNIDKKYIESINEFLIKEIDPVFIYVFGSLAKGYFRDDSDIDVGFYPTEEIDSYKLFMIKEELADWLRRDVDLVNLKKSSTVFKVQVVCNGYEIYSKDENISTEFRIVSLKEYDLLNNNRKLILDRIKKEGKIYD